MEDGNRFSQQKTYLKDYFPTVQIGYSKPSTSSPGSAPKAQSASPLPGIDPDLSKQETRPSLASLKTDFQEQPRRDDPGSRPLDTHSWKQPALSNPSRLISAKPRRGDRQGRLLDDHYKLICAALCAAVLLVAGGIYVWMRIKALPPDVTVYQVGAQNVIQDIGGGGIVYPLQEEDISYPIAERALAVLVAPGDHVSPEQPLIRLDMAQLNAQIQQAYSDVLSSAAYLSSVKASGSAFDVAQAQQSYDLAVNKYTALKAEASSSTLHNGTVISPISGVVTSVYIASGEIFAANRTMIVIMDESTVIVRAQIPLSYLAQVQVNLPATITPSSVSGISLPGKISAIIPRADPQTDTFEIWVTVANPQQLLLPGMSAFVQIQKPGKAFALPRLAVLNLDSQGAVFIERNQRAYIQKVQVIARSLNTIYAGAGISAGDRIILVGLDSLQNGQEVHVTAIESMNSNNQSQ